MRGAPNGVTGILMTKAVKDLVRDEVLAMTAYPVAPAHGMVKLDAMENPYRLPDSLASEMGELPAAFPLPFFG